MVYTKNRIHHAKTPKSTSPYQSLYGSAPSILHLQPFGHAFYAHIPGESRPAGSKLQPCTLESIVVGYDASHRPTSNPLYHIWVPFKRQIIISRNIKFPPFEQGEAFIKPDNDAISSDNEENTGAEIEWPKIKYTNNIISEHPETPSSPSSTPSPKETISTLPPPTITNPTIKPSPSTLQTPQHLLNIPKTITEHTYPPSPTPGRRARFSPSDPLFMEMPSRPDLINDNNESESEFSELSELPDMPGAFDEPAILSIITSRRCNAKPLMKTAASS